MINSVASVDSSVSNVQKKFHSFKNVKVSRPQERKEFGEKRRVLYGPSIDWKMLTETLQVQNNRVKFTKENVVNKSTRKQVSDNIKQETIFKYVLGKLNILAMMSPRPYSIKHELTMFDFEENKFPVSIDDLSEIDTSQVVHIINMQIEQVQSKYKNLSPFFGMNCITGPGLGAGSSVSGPTAFPLHWVVLPLTTGLTAKKFDHEIQKKFENGIYSLENKENSELLNWHRMHYLDADNLPLQEEIWKILQNKLLEIDSLYPKEWNRTPEVSIHPSGAVNIEIEGLSASQFFQKNEYVSKLFQIIGSSLRKLEEKISYSVFKDYEAGLVNKYLELGDWDSLVQPLNEHNMKSIQENLRQNDLSSLENGLKKLLENREKFLDTYNYKDLNIEGKNFLKTNPVLRTMTGALVVTERKGDKGQKILVIAIKGLCTYDASNGGHLEAFSIGPVVRKSSNVGKITSEYMRNLLYYQKSMLDNKAKLEEHGIQVIETPTGRNLENYFAQK